ncbi:RCC1 domain-containing protein 1-like [Periophthalmus magnuspinnatus]|uniref:RCC1 domain-containing protein 1-like n=1 Tax=Periophthalmus magnuspinnatus TaxID=409849 RepID=UPI00145BCA51|nr:RCC1 domain-containing protein 1-like [Periophthalmus magnuspinnatus]
MWTVCTSLNLTANGYFYLFICIFSMRWFGFGFNGFGQLIAHVQTATEDKTDAANEIKVICPTLVNKSVKKCICGLKASAELKQIRASWSRRLSLLEDGCGVFLDGFKGVSSSSNKCCGFVEQSRGCKDAANSESQFTLAFQDRIEVWDFERSENGPVWSVDIRPSVETSDSLTKLPLVPEGYIALKPPFYRPLSPHLQAKSLALGPEHVILLSATGAVYTWGQGSHGQLGHGSLTSEEEPRAVEALWGVPMKAVSAGGWHCCCISATADLYVWGWNEIGQLGLPSRGVRKAQKQNSHDRALQSQDPNVKPGDEPTQTEDDKEVFISIQAFPALLDLNPQCEIKAVSCGSRHTAAVTTEGNLYTWGWGEYGQLGHQNVLSSDEPQCVEFFKERHLHVTDIVCGAWNTFVAVVKQEEMQKSPL